MAKGSQALQILLGTAMLDAQVCEHLLHGDRQALLSNFKLTDDEHRFLLEIRAKTLQGFADAVELWLKAQS